MHALPYDLIRVLKWEAAQATGRDVRRLSFTRMLHRLQSLERPLLGGAAWGGDDEARMAALLAWIAGDVVPDRPGRFEPRRVKRRSRNDSRLTKPRAHYRRHGDNSCRSLHAIRGCHESHPGRSHVSSAIAAPLSSLAFHSAALAS